MYRFRQENTLNNYETTFLHISTFIENLNVRNIAHGINYTKQRVKVSYLKFKIIFCFILLYDSIIYGAVSLHSKTEINNKNS